MSCCLAAILISTFLTPSFCATPGIQSQFQFSSFLLAGTKAANGIYDLQFILFSDAVGGTQIGQTSSANAVRISKGQYSLPVDFGPNTFDGNSRWVEVRPVRSTFTGKTELCFGPLPAS